MEPTPEPTLADSLAHAPHGEGAKAVRRMLLNEAGFTYEYRTVVKWEDGMTRQEKWAGRRAAEEYAAEARAEMEGENPHDLVELTDVWLERRLVGPAERVD